MQKNKNNQEIMIEDEMIPIKTHERASFCLTEITVGTNGFKGGDTGHGSRTYCKFEYNGGGDIDIQVHGDECERVLEIKAGGDDELDSIIESLDFAVNTLKEMSENKEIWFIEYNKMPRFVKASEPDIRAYMLETLEEDLQEATKQGFSRLEPSGSISIEENVHTLCASGHILINRGFGIVDQDCFEIKSTRLKDISVEEI